MHFVEDGGGREDGDVKHTQERGIPKDSSMNLIGHVIDVRC